nr:glucokinase regulatory protein isoform X3 [Callithrix jacchus]
MLGQCDAEIFQEEGQALPTYQRLYKESILTTMVHVAGKVQEVLKEPDGGLVVLSGGGTSGRMAFLMLVSTLVPGFLPSPLFEVTLRTIEITITELPGPPPATRPSVALSLFQKLGVTMKSHFF